MYKRQQLEDKDKNNEIKTLLKDPSNTANILDMMQIALLNTAEFDKNYENMMKYFNRVQDFYQGKMCIRDRLEQVLLFIMARHSQLECLKLKTLCK